MSARANILSRLRGTATTVPPLPDVRDWYANHRRNEDMSQRAARLRTALEAVHTEVHATTRTGLARPVAAHCRCQRTAQLADRRQHAAWRRA